MSARPIEPLSTSPIPIRVAIGIGCDRGTSIETLRAAVVEALGRLGLSPDAVERAATIDRKGDEAAILALTATMGWPLRLCPAAELARVQVPSPSEIVRRHMGTPSVAEAAAILAAGGDSDGLLIEKHKHQGRDGKNATVSIARIAE
jgi:cobalt-precorrin 5A hydrolase